MRSLIRIFTGEGGGGGGRAGGAFWITKDAMVLQADNEDPDQTARMPKLI